MPQKTIIAVIAFLCGIGDVFASFRNPVAVYDTAGNNEILKILRQQGFFTDRNHDSFAAVAKADFFCFFKESGNVRIFNPRDFISFQDSWLFYQLQSGYPFASYQCRPDSTAGNFVYVTVLRQPGPHCVYDSINMGEVKLSGYFLRKIAGLGTGLPYNEDVVQQFRSKMLAVDGYTLSGEAIPSFYFGRFVLNPAVIRQKGDRLSGLLGLATAAGQKPLVTGEADAAFYDLFGHGVSLNARWRRFQARSQELFAGAELPYLLGSPFVTGLHFSLEKYDTVYTRFRQGAMLRFPASREWRWSLGIERTGITGLNIDTIFVKTQRMLPQNAPSRASAYLASLEKVNLQTGVFPREGWSIRLETGIGSRTWLRNAGISAVNWKNKDGISENIFDSLQRIGKMRQTTLKVRYSGAVFMPLAKSLVLFLSFQGEVYKAPGINFSELSRWGGINSIRGFNEQRIFANVFHMANLEFRFMAGQSGFVAPFVSGALYRNAAIQQTRLQSIYSMGLSGGVKTGAGILNFAWALGNEGQGFSMRDAKFHLGISNVF